MSECQARKSAHDVLTFWFEEAGPKTWFTKDEAFDQCIRARFETLACAQAEGLCRTGKSPWQNEAETALALVLVLDQFPRNMYRGSARAFAWDDLALGIARQALDRGHDLAVPEQRRAFFTCHSCIARSLLIRSTVWS